MIANHINLGNLDIEIKSMMNDVPITQEEGSSQRGKYKVVQTSTI